MAKVPQNMVRDKAAGARKGVTVKEEKDNFYENKDGFHVELKWFPEFSFALACAGAFGAIIHFFPENIFVFTNAALFVLFMLLLVLISRLFTIGELFSVIMKAVPSPKRIKRGDLGIDSE